MFREFLSWLGCKINKILALLSIFVLTMLLSCAFGKVLTDIEIKNFILNGYQTKINSNVPENIKNNVLNADFSSWISLMASNEGHYGLQLISNGQTVSLHIISGSASNLENYFPYSNGTSFLVNTNYIRTDYYTFTLSNGSFGGKVNESGWLFSNPRFWWYTDTNIKTNFSNQTKNGTNLYTAPYSDPANAFEENWLTSEIWRFNTGYTNTVHLFGNNTVDYHLIDSSGYIYTVLGMLQDSSLCTGAGYDIMAYNKSKDMWETVYDWGEYFTDSDPISNYFSTGDIDGIPTSSIKLRSNLIIPDTIINFSFARGNSFEDLDKQIDISFYVGGSHTVYSGDSVDYDSTFSDPDYYNDYQYNVDGLVNLAFDDTLNDVNDNLNNGSDVPEIISDYFGSSGEVASKLGFKDYSGDNPYGNVYLTILEGVRQVLIGSGHVVLTCTIHGQTFTFDSDDFQNPSPAIKIFTTSLCVFLMVYTFWGLAFLWAHKLAEGDLLGLKSIVRDTAGSWASIIKRF